jgi:hypothetical protein
MSAPATYCLALSGRHPRLFAMIWGRCRKPTADRDAFQRYVCHTSKRMSCQTPGIRRGSEAQRRGKGDAQPAAGDLRPIRPVL